MYAAVNGEEGSKSVYIMQSFRKDNGKTSSRVHRKLGRYDELMARFNNDYDEMMKWAKALAEKDTLIYKSQTETISVSLSQTAYIPKDEERCFNVGYLFLQKICSELRLENICHKNLRRHLTINQERFLR